MYIKIFIVFLVISLLPAFTSNAGTNTSAQTIKMATSYTHPSVPLMLTTTKQRAEYLVLHYWDNFNYADMSLVNNAEFTEQAFVDYINLLPKTTLQVVSKSIDMNIRDALKGSEAMSHYFAELYAKYLYDPNSPFRSEDFYILFLQHYIGNEKVKSSLKIRPEFQLRMALKNRPGQKATDFTLTLADGSWKRLSSILTDYTILFFNNPDCDECKRVKHLLEQLTKPGVKVVAVYTGNDTKLWMNARYPRQWINGYSKDIVKRELYDLRAIPTLYLLDKNKHVLLKDVSVESILNYLKMTENNK